jgi:hypothetical protein
VVGPPRAMLRATTHPIPEIAKNSQYSLQIEGRRAYSGSMGVGSEESADGE